VKAVALLPAAILAASFSGCVVVPAGPAYDTSAGVAYIAPTYASPGAGYVWERHPRYGWGWHHPEQGWDKGWK
jgi:hypothetical protein